MEISRLSPSKGESDSKPPLYQQIYLLIRDRITNGEYRDQTLLPSEHQMAQLFGVSRITAKRALNELAAEGLCVRKRGQGSRVTYQPSRKPLDSDSQELLNLFSDGHMRAARIVLEFDYRPAGKRIADIMDLDETTEVQHAVIGRSLDGKPLSCVTTYVPADLGRGYNRSHMGTYSTVELLEKTGVKIASAEQTIIATLAEAVTAKRLEVKQGAPLLRISRIVRNHDNCIVEYFVGHYRPDKFQYSKSLTRVDDGIRQFWEGE